MFPIACMLYTGHVSQFTDKISCQIAIEASACVLCAGKCLAPILSTDARSPLLCIHSIASSHPT